MRRLSAARLVILVAAYLSTLPAKASAEWGYTLSGNLGSGVSYIRDTQGEATSWSVNRNDNYSAALDGKIFDPRLATFSLGAALSTNDINAHPRTGDQDTRLLSFIGNLSLLSGKPYPIDLRISQSHFTGSTDTDTLSFGGSWRLLHGNWPALFLNVDRVNIDSSGENPNQTTFTTGTLRASKRIFDSDMDAEFGIQNTTDKVAKTDTARYFGRVSDTTQWSPATTFRVIGDYFLEDQNNSLGANFSLLNRPDPTLSRSFGVAVRRTSNKTQSDTAVDANAVISKTYYPFQTLTITPFTTTIASRHFASGDAESSTLVNWSAGSSLVWSYFRPVLVDAAYGVGLSYDAVEKDRSKFGTTQQFHLGLESRTLTPYRVRGDYTYTMERTLIERDRHQASLRAEAPVRPDLFLRAYGEFFNEDASFEDTKSKQTILTFGTNASYTGVRRLFFDLGANASRIKNEDGSSWITRITANLNYAPAPRLSFQLGAERETDTLTDATRYVANARAVYLFGRTTVTLEYRFESRRILGEDGTGHRIALTLNRPFRFSF